MLFLNVKAHLLPDMLDGVHLVPRGEIWEAYAGFLAEDSEVPERTGRYLSGVSYPLGIYDHGVINLHWYNPDRNAIEIEDWADWETVWVAVESWTEELANEVL